jgi:hypothetical protein
MPDMHTLLMSIRAEMLKTRRTAAVWLSCIAGSFIPVIVSIVVICRPDSFVRLFVADPWWQYMLASWVGAVPFLLPVYVILICSMIGQIEYRNGTWKQVYASPRSYFDIYFTKYIVILLFVLFSLIMFNLTLVVGGYTIGLINSKFAFTQTLPPFGHMIRLTSRIFIAILAMSAIQYWLSIRFRNFIVSFGIGFAVMVTSLILQVWDPAHYIPYLYPTQVYRHEMFGGGIPTEETLRNSILIFITVMLLGYLDLLYRREKA